MDVRTFSDPHAFEHAAGPLLRADPARNNLPLGILSTLITHPQMYPTFDLWLAETNERPAGAAIRTAPFKVVLVEPSEAGAVDALCDVVAASDPDIPGVVANVPWADHFADRWCASTGAHSELALAQGVYALTQVVDPRPASGVPRRCVPKDRALLRRWIEDFQTEALSHQTYDPDRTERTLDVRLSDDDGDGLWFWERDGAPVSLAGYGGAGDHGTRIGPVYTPREHRGNGYASNLVADLSRWALARGSTACYLYTDLSNPTSNGIYVGVGYEKVAESAEVAFVSG